MENRLSFYPLYLTKDLLLYLLHKLKEFEINFLPATDILGSFTGNMAVKIIETLPEHDIWPFHACEKGTI